MNEFTATELKNAIVILHPSITAKDKNLTKRAFSLLAKKLTDSEVSNFIKSVGI